MKKYDAYKPSGIEWIGEIPEGWEKCRFKNIVTLINRPTSGGNKIGLENIESGSGKYLPSDSEFDGDGVGFAAGDIVYGKLRPYLMKVWVAEFPGNAVGDFFVFRVKDNADSSFVKYLMLSDGFTKEANGATEGAKMPRVSSDFILTLRYYLPSKEEQTAIADYLDAKCAKIDNVVTIQQKRIELLKELKQSIITHAVTKGLDKNAKMKDSGIEWIGEVPEYWEMIRLRFIASFKTGGTPEKKDGINSEDLGYSWFTASDFTNNYILSHSEQFITSDSVRKYGYNLFPPESVLLVCIASIGKIGITQDFSYANQQITAIKPKKDVFPKYLMYFIESQSEKIISDASSNVVPIVNTSYLSDIWCCFPPHSEQTDIADYLDKKCAIIDRQIAKVEKQIDLLNEYKQSVITECVTGKRKVC